MNFKRLRWVVSLPEHATAVSGAKRSFTKTTSPISANKRHHGTLDSSTGVVKLALAIFPATSV